MSPGAIRPLPRPVPLRQSVYDALIDLIVGGELPPGQHMVETDLARQLGVSRQPIREALHRMEAEGWVDLRPSQGAFVHVPTDSEVDELLDVRALLEAETAGLAARAASPDQVATLREICAGGRAAAEQGDVDAAVAANDSFHAEIATIAGNSVLAELADIVARRVQWYYRMVAPARGRDSWAEHGDMTDAIEAADPEQAKLLARRHTERTRDAYHGSLSLQGSLPTLTGSGAYGSFALPMSSIWPRSDMMWYGPSRRRNGARSRILSR
jgi:DNA-binding GntR family transcriptional regulator